MPKYISIAEAAREKRCARNSIYVAIATKKIDAEEIAGKPVVLKNKKYEDYKPKKSAIIDYFPPKKDDEI